MARKSGQASQSTKVVKVVIWSFVKIDFGEGFMLTINNIFYILIIVALFLPSEVKMTNDHFDHFDHIALNKVECVTRDS